MIAYKGSGDRASSSTKKHSKSGCFFIFRGLCSTIFYTVTVYFNLFYTYICASIKNGIKMDTLSIRFVFDRKGVANDTDTQGLLQIEVREIGTSNKVFISTGIKLFKKQYSKKK